ncbi:MAG TPA: hypothetical protein DDZ76_00830 [Xanthomonadales bacterium]|nr:hypothetical protein [Xanthomonadales bacterium]
MVLLAGLLIGFLAFLWFALSDRLAPGPQRSPSQPAPQPTAPADPKRRFDFYELLPGREVQIPDAELREKAQAEREAARQPEPTAPTPTPAPMPAPSGGERLLLQAGSFGDPARADELKARIALAGEVARIETASVQGRTVYRVILGPYPSAQALEAAKSRLSGLGIESIAVRAR